MKPIQAVRRNRNVVAVLKGLYSDLGVAYRVAYRSVRFRLFFNPKTQTSRETRDRFADVTKVWKPIRAPEVILLRWFITEWCNYKCAYCDQTHGRFEPKGKKLTAHAFDNFSLEKWMEAFQRHFSGKRLSLVLTGGEPMVDKKMMVPFLNFVSSMNGTECIRIDTNAWWDPKLYADLDKSKITLMCTFHPSQTTRDKFIERIRMILEGGFEIALINYVMTADQLGSFLELKEQFDKLGVPLHPNPLWNSVGLYSESDLRILKDWLPKDDYLYRTQIESPKGRHCLFPSLSYEMDYRGKIQVGCHEDTAKSFFDATLPVRFDGPVPCPMTSCVCLDKYSFLQSINRNTTTNPLRIYSGMLKHIHGIGHGGS